MEKIVLSMKFEKYTANTVVYGEIATPGRAPILKALYLQKWALGEKPPLELTVTIEHIPVKPKEE